jgi:hypothetical protein
MVERIVAQITVALIAWLDRRIERGSSAVDADDDRQALRRAGNRIREWVRKPDGVRAGRESDEGRTPQ